jgi:hypothetical protein
MTRSIITAAAAALFSGALAFAGPPTTQPTIPDLSPELQQPFKVMAGKEAIDVEIGHAAPFFADVTGDGVKDLLVGQFGEGKLRIYTNIGTRTDPKFDKYEWFKAGAEVGKVPAG